MRPLPGGPPALRRVAAAAILAAYAAVAAWPEPLVLRRHDVGRGKEVGDGMRLVRRLLARAGITTPFGRDAVLATFVAVSGLASLLVWPIDWQRGGLLVALVLGSSIPLAWRRRAPVAAFIAVAVVTALEPVLPTVLPTSIQSTNTGILFALYALGAYGPRRAAVIGTVTIAVVHGLGVAVLTGPPALEAGLTAPVVLVGAVTQATMFAAAALLGAYMQTRRAYTAELVDRAERLDRDREERAERAVADERARLARELHDVVAHHLSGLIVQAGAAERVTADEQARATLADIRESGRTTLAQMRRLVGILRADDGDGRAPQPGLGRLDLVIDQAHAAGIDVELRVHGDPAPLPDEVDLAAYRVLQEGLTNVRKHAPGSTAVASVRYRPSAVEVEVSDDGAQWPTEDEEPSGGVGLVGARERVALLSGDFGAGPNSRGGWTIHARLPTDGNVRA